MVGLLVLAVRAHAPPALIPETFGPSRIHIPKAPSLGLFLDRPHFDRYNRKVRETTVLAGQTDGAREPLEYDEGLLARVEIFKQEEVLEAMWAEEARDETCVVKPTAS